MIVTTMILCDDLALWAFVRKYYIFFVQTICMENIDDYTSISDFIIKNNNIENLVIPQQLIEKYDVSTLYPNDKYLPIHQWIISRKDELPKKL